LPLARRQVPQHDIRLLVDAKLVLVLLGAKLFDRLVEAVPLGRESVAALCQACDQLIGLATVVSAKPTFERRRHRCKLLPQ
jgi:hypothetical protein